MHLLNTNCYMFPLVIAALPLTAIVGAIWLINYLTKEEKLMANCHQLFRDFNGVISISTSKKNRLKDSKNKLREKIRKHFKENHPEYEPKFYIQGSYKMKTIIRTKDDICDLDDGVYFFRTPNVTSTTLQGWVYDAVNGHTNTAPEHRKKCIRNIFASDYEIDMPVYYKIDGQQYQLAIKNEGWRDDDPKAMVNWFEERKNTQLVDTVKYLKAWCDNVRGYMPSGLAMIILATNAKANIVMGERDDINLKDILKEMKKSLDREFTCIVPADPGDDLFQNYTEDRQDKFMKALGDFITDAEAALREENQLAASKLWRKHLGDRFPLGEDKKEENKRNNSLIAGIGNSSPYGTK